MSEVSSITLVRLAEGTCVSVMLLFLISICMYSGYHLLILLMCLTIRKLNTVTDPITAKAIIVPNCEMGLINSSLFLGSPILLISESYGYTVNGDFWTLIRYGSLFICTIPLLLDDEDDNTSNVAIIA
jgi:hypothetical protein